MTDPKPHWSDRFKDEDIPSLDDENERLEEALQDMQTKARLWRHRALVEVGDDSAAPKGWRCMFGAKEWRFENRWRVERVLGGRWHLFRVHERPWPSPESITFVNHYPFAYDAMKSISPDENGHNKPDVDP